MPLAPLAYMDFKRAIAFHLHWGDLADLPQSEKDTLHRLIQNAVSKVFFPLDPRGGPNQGRLYEWSWASPLRSLIVRAAVTGTLTAVPTRIGGQIFVIAASASIFDSDLLGHGLSFDSSGQRFVIAEVISGNKVKLAAALQPGVDDTLLGDRRTTTLANSTFERLSTVITESSSTKAFYADMVGDEVQFATSGTAVPIVGVDVDASQVRVNGDVTGESANAMTVVRRAYDVGSANGGPEGATGVIVLHDGTVARADMADESDTVTFVGGGAGVYTITAAGSRNAALKYFLNTAVLAAADIANNQTVDIKKAFSTDYSLSAVGGESVVTANPLDIENPFFKSDDVGQKLAFLNQYLNTYEILSLVGVGVAAVISGDVTGEEAGTEVSVVRTGGALDATAVKTFDGVSTVLTATAAVFDATMEGLVIEFPLPIGGASRKYVIAEFTSTTVIKVAGDATDEGAPFQKFLVVGPSDLGANDAFTVANTGADYELPLDFGGLDGPITFSTDGWSNTIDFTSEFNVRKARQRSTASGRPQIAAVRPQVHDGRFTQRNDLLLWPTPESKHTLQYRQIVILPEISEENLYPPGGAAYGQLYLEACLAEADAKINDRRGLPWTEFQERLAAMIEVDGLGTGAEQLGPGHEEGQMLARVIPAASGVTYIPT